MRLAAAGGNRTNKEITHPARSIRSGPITEIIGSRTMDAPSFQDIADYIRISKDTIGLLKGVFDLLPKGAKRDEAEQKIKAAEEALKRADATLAQKLGYSLVPLHVSAANHAVARATEADGLPELRSHDQGLQPADRVPRQALRMIGRSPPSHLQTIVPAAPADGQARSKPALQGANQIVAHLGIEAKQSLCVPLSAAASEV
jgi:hypothetical protein